MVFVSEIFLFYFLPLVLLVAYFLRRKSVILYLGWLSVASVVFYSWETPFYFLLIVFCVLSNWFLTSRMHQSQDATLRRSLFLGVLILNVGMLIFFKYTKFLATNFNQLTGVFGIQLFDPAFGVGRFINNIVFPLGISFYTFHLLSYAIDLYVKKITPARTFIEFVCYVTFFPQLVAGPIVRYSEIQKDLGRPETNHVNIQAGTVFFIIGLAKKALIADSLAPFVNCVFDGGGTGSGLLTLLGTVAYAFQIYFDFSGYSEMAVGMGLMLGIKLPQNFNSPYKSKSVTEFWRRWHMTLSFWFRDYLFFPLSMRYLSAGNTELNRYLPVLIVMVLIGFWHGAGWTFFMFGLIYGIALIAEDVLIFRKKKKTSAITQIWFWCVMLSAYILFRSTDLKAAGGVFHTIFFNLLNKSFFHDVKSLPLDALIGGALIAPVAWMVLFQKNVYEMDKRLTLSKAILLSVLFIVSVYFLLARDYIPFLYFQF
ncbi:MAG: MBOAT family protein [Candidatus Omnitrophica bacterium]|nr:MBOAT family protein [Candidatus Omnitrophota bacterium]